MPRRISTVVGREFGDGLRTVIERTGRTYRNLAERLGWDHQKLSDLINGKGGSTDIELMFLLGLFRETRERGYLQVHDSGVPDQVGALIAREKLATQITSWSPLLVPGLLQTPAYVRAAALASPRVIADDLDRLVAARSGRREMLERGRQFTYYVQRHALTLPVGGPEVMAEQLHELLRFSVRPNISLRVVPLATMSGFRVMKFAKFEPVVWLESPTSTLFLDDKASIGLYDHVVKELDQIALSE